MLFNLGDERAQALRKRNAAAADANKTKIIGAIILFDDLVREADEGALNLRGRHDAALCAQAGCGKAFRHKD
jgi:hypothetical protein